MRLNQFCLLNVFITNSVMKSKGFPLIYIYLYLLYKPRGDFPPSGFTSDTLSRYVWVVGVCGIYHVTCAYARGCTWRTGVNGRLLPLWLSTLVFKAESLYFDWIGRLHSPSARRSPSTHWNDRHTLPSPALCRC